MLRSRRVDRVAIYCSISSFRGIANFRTTKKFSRRFRERRLVLRSVMEHLQSRAVVSENKKKTVEENHESPKKENKNKQKETEMENLRQRGFQRCREYWKQ